MAIVVLSPGILTSVQDGGRYGYQQYGVSPSGPMDSRALATANLLVGNDPAEAGLEMTLMGAELKFTDAALIALTGADMGASLSGVKADRYRALQVKTGDVLKLGFALSGCRGYLAVRGGIDVKKVMGSRSTMIGKSFGGFEGRKLMKGDVLKIRPAEGDLPRAGALRPGLSLPVPDDRGAVLPGAGRIWASPGLSSGDPFAPCGGSGGRAAG